MNVLQKAIVVTIGVMEVFRLGVQFLVPYPVLAGAVRCGPWIVSLVSKPATHPCRLAASGRIRESLLEVLLAAGLGFVLAVVAGAWGAGGNGGGGGGGEPPPDDERPKDPGRRSVRTAV
jgi:hypothetical protein